MPEEGVARGVVHEGVGVGEGDDPARGRGGGVAGPFDLLAFWAPFAHAWHISQELVDALRGSRDERLLTVLSQPPAAARLAHLILLGLRYEG